MASLNKVMIIGRLGRDPELSYTQNGTAIARFNVATDESFKNNQGEVVERTEWHKVVTWGRQAEPVANYMHKGSLCYVEGKLETQKWTDKEGNDRYTTQINSSRIQFLDPKRDNGGNGGQQARSGNQGSRQKKTEETDLGPAFPSEAQGMDDVPF